MPEAWPEDEDGRLKAVHEYLTEITENPNPDLYLRNETLTDEQQPIAVTSEMYKNDIWPNRME